MSEARTVRRAMNRRTGAVWEQRGSGNRWKVIEAKGGYVEVGDTMPPDDGEKQLKQGYWKELPFDLSTLDTAGVFHHAQQPAPVAERYAPTWGPEWEYVDGYGSAWRFRFIAGSDSQCPVRLVSVGGSREMNVDMSGRLVPSYESRFNIVSQRPSTPAPVETPAPSQPADVPQWCRDAAREFLDVKPMQPMHQSAARIVAEQQAELAAIIARHAVAAPEVAELRERLTAAEEHERQTHERLGAILGTDDSLEECAKRLKADRDATKVQWQSLHDEREEQYAALRRAKVKFMRFGKQLEAVCPSEYSDMFQSAMPEDVIQEAEKIAEACAANADNHDDVSADEMQNVSLRLLDLRHQYQELQKAYHWKGCVNDELSHQVERLTAEHASALALVADIRAALGDNGKRMQPELIEYCRSLSAAEAERDEARAEVERLKAELEREEREHGNTIDHRDQHEASINLICDALGMDEAEVAWSSHNDPPTNAVRRIEKLFDEVANWKSEAERNGLFELRQVEEREAIKKAVGFEEIGPTMPEHCRLLAAELTTLRERLAAAEERIAAVREIVEQVKLSALKQADYEYAATMLNLRDCLDHGNAIDLDRLATLLPSAGRFVSIRAREKQIDELHERVKFFDEELNDTTARLSAAEAERDEAREEAKRYCDQYSEAQRQRSMAAKSLEYAELEISRLQNERNDLGDCEIQLRADLARAKEDGERMRELAARLADRLRQAQAQWKMYADERIEYDDKGNEIYFSEADHAEADLWRNGEKALKESLAAIAPRAAGAEENHFAEAGKMVVELRRQSLEAHMRGDLNTADRLAALIGDKLPSTFEKEDLHPQHEEGGE